MKIININKRNTSFTIIGIIAIIFIAVIAGSVIKSQGGDEKNKKKAPDISAPGNSEIEFPVTAVVVRKGNLIIWINTSGYAYPVEQYEIKPKISGQVTVMNTYNGMSVKKGEFLFQLDDTEYKLDVNQAKSDLVKAQIEYELQKSNSNLENRNPLKYKLKSDSVKVQYDHSKKLYNEGKLSFEDLSRIERDYETLKTIANLNREDVVASRCGLTNAATRFKKAELNLSYTRYKAPISGLIADCNISKGSYVLAGNPSLKVIDISSIKMQCEVTESDLVKINTGEPVKAEFIALPGKKFTGKVTEINPSIDITKRTALITVLIDNPKHLIKPGMFASVTIGTNNYFDRIVIPHSALLARQNRTMLFTVENGLAQWKYVTIGESNDRYYEVKKGVKAGDTLIVGGNYNLAHQSAVKITSLVKY